VVEELERRLRNPLLQAIRGSVDRAARTRRPRPADIDWERTIRRNLKNYLPERRAIIVEQLVGHGRRQCSLHDVVLCVDQSGSMASSVVYASVFAAVLASTRAVRTRMIAFDTSVVDLTDELHDPVDLLFGTQLGGGTDIDQALGYCAQVVTRPAKTVLVLITDLFEGGDVASMRRRAADLVASGVKVVCLLALSDDGAPIFDEENAAAFARVGIPTFACTPDAFPDLMAAAIEGRDLGLWAARQGIVGARG
jgi:Mg-chelatase subunit ChlD